MRPIAAASARRRAAASNVAKGSPASPAAKRSASSCPPGKIQPGQVIAEGLAAGPMVVAGSTAATIARKLKDHYGYVRGTVGFDKDHVDVFIKPGTPEDWNGPVYVVNQNNRNGKFDEHKVMLGFDSEAAARKAYLSNYSPGWKGLASVAQMSVDEFKTWATDKTENGPKGGALEPVQGDKELSPAEQKRREGLRRKAAERKQIDPQRDSIISAVIKLGGIHTDNRLDITGDDKGNKGIPGVGYLFSRAAPVRTIWRRGSASSATSRKRSSRTSTAVSRR
jgi:hypothetical protein